MIALRTHKKEDHSSLLPLRLVLIKDGAVITYKQHSIVQVPRTHSSWLHLGQGIFECGYMVSEQTELRRTKRYAQELDQHQDLWSHLLAPWLQNVHKCEESFLYNAHFVTVRRSFLYTQLLSPISEYAHIRHAYTIVRRCWSALG